jgi:hypothetical protein
MNKKRGKTSLPSDDLDTKRKREIVDYLRKTHTDPEILDIFKQVCMDECRRRKITFMDDSHICNACGRENLKETEMTYRVDKDNQIILESVLCTKCVMPSFYSALLPYVKPGHEKDAEKILEKMASDFEYNYNRRTARRVLSKKRV